MPSTKASRRVEELIRIYAAADARLNELMLRAQASDRLAEARYRRRVLLQVKAILAALKKSSSPAVARAVMSSYEDGQLLARAPGEKRIQGAFGGPHRVAINELAKALSHSLDNSVVIIGRSVQDVFRQETLRVNSERLAKGDTLEAGSKQLQEALLKRGKTAFIDKRGNRWSLENYATMAIQTTTSQATSEGLKNRMLEQGYDLVKISSHVHKHDECSPYDGKTFSITGKTPGYEVLDKWPPFHPRCRHVAIAAKENFD